jgi:hypothetical protein
MLRFPKGGLQQIMQIAQPREKLLLFVAGRDIMSQPQIILYYL